MVSDAKAATAVGRPSFFIVGQMKSGTTALYRMLRQHPEVFMPDLKEPQFFASDLRRRFRPPGRGPLPETIDEYLGLFESAGPSQTCGEASAIYILSEKAAAEIAEFNPEARVIAMLREPAALIRSLHLQALKDRNEVERDLARALELEPERRRGERIPRTCYRPQELLYSDHVRYVEQLERFYAALPREQVLVLLHDDLRADNEGAVRRVLDFIGVDDTVPTAPAEVNASATVRSHAALQTINRVSAGRGGASRALKRLASATTTPALRRKLLDRAYGSVLTAPPPADEELMAALRRRFAPAVAELSEYLDRDLVSLWGYGEREGRASAG